MPGCSDGVISDHKETITKEILARFHCGCTTVIVQKGHLGAEGLQVKKEKNGKADNASRQVK